MTYALNFVIPEGPTGPQGPKGEQGAKGENGTTGLNAYGGLYNSGGQINLGISTSTVANLPSSLPNYNLSYNGNNGILIDATGTYEISYHLLFTVSYATRVTINIRENANNIPNLGITKDLTTGTDYSYSGSTIVKLNEGDIITMNLLAQESTNINLNSGNGASLIVKKID